MRFRVFGRKDLYIHLFEEVKATTTPADGEGRLPAMDLTLRQSGWTDEATNEAGVFFVSGSGTKVPAPAESSDSAPAEPKAPATAPKQCTSTKKMPARPVKVAKAQVPAPSAPKSSDPDSGAPDDWDQMFASDPGSPD